MVGGSLLKMAIHPGAHQKPEIKRHDHQLVICGLDQIATVAKHRLKSQAGKLSLKDLQNVERVVRLQLGL